ncbi:hypothetical protein ACIQLK_09855 [Microbacterium sp. NPDC091382]|uniref:hypothetical protein n=1 Tax=Microbacterium sp. NPDC091382 TaxID=3364210 RepID=UPI0038254C17
MHRHLLAIPAFAFAIVVLSGCNPGDSGGGLVGSDSESPVVVATPTAATPTGSAPSPSPTPAEFAAEKPTSAPDCGSLLDVNWAQSALDPRVEGPDDYTATSSEKPGQPGPVAQTALERSDLLRVCGWGIPHTDGGFGASVYAIQAEDRTQLTEALAGSDVWTEHREFTRTVYSRVWDSGIGYGLAYGFADGYWVISSGSLVSPDDAATVVRMSLEALVAARS